MEFNRGWPKPLPFPGHYSSISLFLSLSLTHTAEYLLSTKYFHTLHLQNETGSQEIMTLPFKTIVSYFIPKEHSRNVCWMNLSVNTQSSSLFSIFRSSLAPNCTVLGRSWFTVDPWRALLLSSSYSETSFYVGQSDLSWTHIRIYHCSKAFDGYYP